MTNTIISYYKGEFKEAVWLIGIAVANFTMGIVSIAKWGDVGAGILVILGGFAIYQIIRGFWVVLVEQNRPERKTLRFEKDQTRFLKHEINLLEKSNKASERNKTYKLVSLLFGLLCLFMGAFGGWNDILLGIGVGLSIQSAIMLILGLLSDSRAFHYLQKLKKVKPEKN